MRIRHNSQRITTTSRQIHLMNDKISREIISRSHRRNSYSGMGSQETFLLPFRQRVHPHGRHELNEGILRNDECSLTSVSTLANVPPEISHDDCPSTSTNGSRSQLPFAIQHVDGKPPTKSSGRIFQHTNNHTNL